MSSPDSSREPKGSTVPDAEVSAETVESTDLDTGQTGDESHEAAAQSEAVEGNDPPQGDPVAEPAPVEVVPPVLAEPVAEPEESVPAPEAEPEEEMKWYIVHTYSGFEAKVKESLRQRVEAMNMGHEIDEVLIPTEEVVEVKEGKKTRSSRKFFPGYVLVKMIMTDDAWHVVKNTPKEASKVEFDSFKMYIHKATFIPVKVEFEKGGAVYRTAEVLEVKDIQGFKTVTKSRMSDSNMGGHTTVEYADLVYDAGLPADLFTERYLRRAPREYLK